MANPQQRSNIAVATGLVFDTVTRIDQDNREITGRGTGGHIARVLLVTWGVGNNKFALSSAEITVGHINGDALLALSLQAVDQQRQVNIITCGADFFRVAGDGF